MIGPVQQVNGTTMNSMMKFILNRRIPALKVGMVLSRTYPGYNTTEKVVVHRLDPGYAVYLKILTGPRGGSYKDEWLDWFGPGQMKEKLKVWTILPD